MQKPWRSTGYWFLPMDFSSCFISNKDHHLRGGIIPSNLSTPLSNINQENTIQSCLQEYRMLACFLNLESFLQINMILCQDNMKDKTTISITH